jgi:hypothetical protein
MPPAGAEICGGLYQHDCRARQGSRYLRTDVTTPQNIFSMPQHLTVPIYQRPYVWTEDEQWGPLWADVRRVAEHQLGSMSTLATHFLGAVVTQRAAAGPVGVQEFLIVDGQQRLTTLQLVLDAAAGVFELRGLLALKGQLEFLTHNSTNYVGGDSPLKLQHTNRDREAFAEVMLASPPVDYSVLKSRESLIVRAHEYFAGQVDRWLSEAPDRESERAQALSVALQTALQLVVIGLDASEDSQEIFETLNARGTPLTAADLIKNFVFQRIKQEGHDQAKVFQEAWPFDTKFWEEQVTIGRFSTTRSALFLGQWLVSRVGQEVSPRSTFTRFRYFVEHEAGLSMVDLLYIVKEQANYYEHVTQQSADKRSEVDREALHVYRMSALQTEITKPVLLWLKEPGNTYSTAVVDRVLTALESWIIRRRLLRLQSSDQGRIAALLIDAARGTSDQKLAETVQEFLARQQFASTYWPGDDEIRGALATEPFYRRFSQPVQRVVLQAVEDWYRGYTSAQPSKTGVRVQREGQQIEHILPRSWRANWPVDDPAVQADRDDHVNRLGNLTLISGALNASISNGAWLTDGGKRAALNKHDVFLMNRTVYARSADGWDETLIDERTEELTKAVLDTWPVPSGHVGKVIDRRSRLTKATVTYGDLIVAGLLESGTTLYCASPRWADATCTLLAGGAALYEGQTMSSPASVARKVCGGSTNAWFFWKLGDGRVLNEIREELLGKDDADDLAIEQH